MIAILYYGTVTCILLYLICVFVYISSLILSGIFGAPYVKTKRNLYKIIFKHARISKNSHIVEVGSGTGSMSIYLSKKYNCLVTGIEINPILLYISRIKKKIFKRNKLDFVLEDALHFDYSAASHVYVFMFPQIIRKLAPILKKQCKQGTVIISHGFPFIPFKKYLVRKVDLEPFPIYYYEFKVDI